MKRRDLLAGAGGALLASPVLGQTSGRGELGAVTTELATYASRGRTIRAAAFRPDNDASGAGVVFLHGSGGMGVDQLAFARRFAEAGHLALAPTYLDAAEDNVVRPEPVMDAWRRCASDGVEWLIDQGIARRRTAVIGYSLGSYIAVDGALGDSRAAAAISICGGWDVYIPRAPQRRIPVLLIRNDRDRVVSADSTSRWKHFLLQADVPVRERVNRGAGHLMNAAQWNAVYRQASDFLADALRPD